MRKKINTSLVLFVVMHIFAPLSNLSNFSTYYTSHVVNPISRANREPTSFLK